MSLRVPVLVFAGMFVATLVLIGCDAVDHSPAPAEEDPAAGHLNLTWNDLASDEGTALVLTGEGNRQIFHMACLRADREMQIIASDFTVIGSEERMTMGIANEAFGFVADTQWTGGGVMPAPPSTRRSSTTWRAPATCPSSMASSRAGLGRPPHRISATASSWPAPRSASWITPIPPNRSRQAWV